MSYSRILVVEDEPGIGDQLVRWLSSEGYDVEKVQTGKDALEILRKSSFNLILLDLRLPDIDGLEILEKVSKEYPEICNIVLTAYSSDESIIRARNLGAFDFFEKPVQFEALSLRIDEAIAQFWSQRQGEYQRQEQEKHFQFENIIGRSRPMVKMFEEIKRVANTDETVLLLGESGTGKNLVAGAIHYNSRRKNQTLVTANCTTLNETLAESELFGHEKGAFTGADARKIGKIERANRTSLFIDECGELSLVLQSKFLQLIQEKTFERVGGHELISVDTRIIAATNIDLERAVKERQFRNDLFYRLERFVIRIPPLRERKSDIRLLVERCIKACNRRSPASPGATFISGQRKGIGKYHHTGHAVGG
jgi:DNA-binding NtrC family response regulator